MKNINDEVKNFYKNHAFNMHGDIDNECKSVKKFKPFKHYKFLKKYLNKDLKILDAGCGSGRMLNSLNYHYNISGDGIDINDIAIENATFVSQILNLNNNFFIKNIFNLKSNKKYNFIISNGVLHHTENCHDAIKKLIDTSLSDNGYLFIGLYHKDIRSPFLKYFNDLKLKNNSVDFLINKFFEINLNLIEDPDFGESWFFDQVLHPHETQHSFLEISKVLEDLGCKVILTSLNNYKKINGTENWIEIEKSLSNEAQKKINNMIYDPGFFTILAQKL
jgi:SAM-dependent methyltransferase